MNKKNILFPTDFSTASDAALIHAESFAKQSSATLIILHVEEPLWPTEVVNFITGFLSQAQSEYSRCSKMYAPMI